MVSTNDGLRAILSRPVKDVTILDRRHMAQNELSIPIVGQFSRMNFDVRNRNTTGKTMTNAPKHNAREFVHNA